MKTDDLIDALAVSLEPVKPARPSIPYLAAAACASLAAVAILLGIRPDLPAGLQTPALWLKSAYTLALAGGGLWLVQRLGRPGADARPALRALLAIVALAVACGAVEMVLTPPSERLAEWLGRTWKICGRNILVVSCFTAPFVFLSVRRLAPTRLTASGAAIGMTAGALAATAYGVLHCPEPTAAFVATWYTLGVAAAGAAGALTGRFALRW